jgi:inner membrane protein
MDPITHTFTGAALAAAGLRRATPLASAALIAGTNLPDVDVFSGVFGPYAPIAFRRGWTHGVLALVVIPLVLTAALLAWDRYVRRRRNPGAARARAGPLLAVAALAVVTHPTLDWLNNYGLRWLMPFDGRWFYGEAVFIIDPWLWLIFGGGAFLTYSQSRLARIAWAVFFTLATLLIVANVGLVPAPSAGLWTAGVAALIVLRWRLANTAPAAFERTARLAMALGSAYIATLAGASAAARSDVRTSAAAQGIALEAVALAPNPANPFAADVVIMTRDEYFTGRFDWLAAPHLTVHGERVPRPNGPLFEAAARTRDARHYLVWSRFPAIDVEPVLGGGTLVHLYDMRYRAMGRIPGPTVRLDAAGVAVDTTGTPLGD